MKSPEIVPAMQLLWALGVWLSLLIFNIYYLVAAAHQAIKGTLQTHMQVGRS